MIICIRPAHPDDHLQKGGGGSVDNDNGNDKDNNRGWEGGGGH